MGLAPLNEGELLEISLQELRNMDANALLQTLHRLGYDTEKITTKTQALTKLIENAVDMLDA